MERFSGAARPTLSRQTTTFAAFISGLSSGWIRESRSGHGNSAETAHEAGSEAHPDAILAAGDQAAADVDARAGRPAEPGDGREPAPRGSPHRRSATRRTAGRKGRGNAAARRR